MSIQIETIHEEQPPATTQEHLERLGNLAVGNPAAEISLGVITRHLAELEQAYKEVSYEATHDPLTGVYNRSGFFKTAPALTTQLNESCSALLSSIDLDKFKELNDLNGHITGDVALKAVAQGLRTAAPQGIAARFGGDEFIVLQIVQSIGEKAEQDAKITEETMRRHIEAAIAQRPELSNLTEPITFSIGHSIHGGDSQPDIDRMLRESDAKMYRHKRGEQPRTS